MTSDDLAADLALDRGREASGLPTCIDRLSAANDAAIAEALVALLTAEYGPEPKVPYAGISAWLPRDADYTARTFATLRR